MAQTIEHLTRFDIPGRVSTRVGQGGMPKVEMQSNGAHAEVYLHGAHITSFQLRDQPPLLFLSHSSRFETGRAIRGGIPVILPWFGPREGAPAHGFARLIEWELQDSCALPEGGASVRFAFPEAPTHADWPPFTATYRVTVAHHLKAELVITNRSPNLSLNLENCLHTYFRVGDIAQVSIRGLKGTTYLDETRAKATAVESGEAITVAAEVDRLYLDTASPVEILDPSLGRRILVEKNGSLSTVVWNPWQAKSSRMSDFGDEEYREMVCVESGNVGRNSLTLPPGASSSLQIVLSSAALQPERL